MVSHFEAEKLPYLVRIQPHCLIYRSLLTTRQSACIKEGLRLGYGPIGRLPRVVPEPGAVFQGRTIPAGVSHDSEPR